MALTSLPTDIHEAIYAKLEARDRVRFLIALPKGLSGRIRRQPPWKEHKMHVLAKSIAKGKVSRISDGMRAFLSTCDPNDPTLVPIRARFPNEAPIVSDEWKSIVDCIKDGSLGAHQLPPVNADLTDIVTSAFKNAIYMHCSPAVFDTLMTHVGIVHHLTDDRTARALFFNLFNYNNEKLLLHIMAKSKEGVFPYNVNALLEYVAIGTRNMLGMWTTPNTRKMMLKHLSTYHTKAYLEGVWLLCMNEMYVDVAEEIDAMLKLL